MLEDDVKSFLPIDNRTLSCEYKRGFAAISSHLGENPNLPQESQTPQLWTLYEKIRTDFQRQKDFLLFSDSPEASGKRPK